LRRGDGHWRDHDSALAQRRLNPRNMRAKLAQLLLQA
jgi:hypothetical protein